ncbi:hypothetical protein ACFQS1_16735 [Paractinoplanes rhizophilus]|jgi:hypothetical protein|uniref:Uncharacterized protein n=1 Tax=Paractinoplanes rhizophilus TaxID=1416877 RepID=A0ABW2HR01_9ACTN|nr:hypothetical protein [Actinoplanes sp.]
MLPETSAPSGPFSTRDSRVIPAYASSSGTETSRESVTDTDGVPDGRWSPFTARESAAQPSHPP